MSNRKLTRRWKHHRLREKNDLAMEDTRNERVGKQDTRNEEERSKKNLIFSAISSNCWAFPAAATIRFCSCSCCSVVFNFSFNWSTYSRMSVTTDWRARNGIPETLRPQQEYTKVRNDHNRVQTYCWSFKRVSFSSSLARLTKDSSSCNEASDCCILLLCCSLRACKSSYSTWIVKQNQHFFGKHMSWKIRWTKWWNTDWAAASNWGKE